MSGLQLSSQRVELTLSLIEDLGKAIRTVRRSRTHPPRLRHSHAHCPFRDIPLASPALRLLAGNMEGDRSMRAAD